jgi:hypothetical protein
MPLQKNPKLMEMGISLYDRLRDITAADFDSQG